MNKKTFFTALVAILAFASTKATAQIVINEIQYEGTDLIELKNLGDSAVDVSSYWLCSFPLYNQIANVTVESGSTTIPAGGLLVLSGHTLDNDDELGLYTSASFANADAIVDYVEWAGTGHTRSGVGVTAGTWTTGEFVPAGQSINFDGEGNSASDYVTGTPSFGNENATLSSDFILNDISVSIYPNPASDLINIDLSDSKAFVTLYSLSGKIITTKHMAYKKPSIDISDLANGIYILKITTNRGNTKAVKIFKK